MRMTWRKAWILRAFMLTLGRNYRVAYWFKKQLAKKLGDHTPGSNYFQKGDQNEKKKV